MSSYNLFMLLIGCRPAARNTEQHDVFFGIAKQLRDLVPEIRQFWKGASPLHLDAWRIVNHVDGYRVSIREGDEQHEPSAPQLFFLNLGGYKEHFFEEFHYKMLTVAHDKADAASNAKKTAFFQHTGFSRQAAAHIDDRFGVDVDDLFEIKEILPAVIKQKFSVCLEKNNGAPLPADDIHLGYFKLHEL